MSEEAADDEAEAWSARSAKLDRLVSQHLWIAEPTAALEVLGLVGREREHQSYIAWLLNPGGSHGLSSEVLANLLRLQGSVIPADLSQARVRTEHVRGQSRADIVVAMPGCTLVIELKVHSGEGNEQTRRLADDHAGSSNPLFVFLTLNGDEPLDCRFQRMRLREFVGCLQSALSNAPEPRNQNPEHGRATASDYLRALERMCGMEPVNQHAARFWLRHGDELMKARNEAGRLLGMLPERVETVLAGMAYDLGEDVRVTRLYYAVPRPRAIYREVAVLVHRSRWLKSGGQTRLGVGFGQRIADVDPFDFNKAPFFGIWAEDPAARASMGDANWHNWAWWDSLALKPPDGDEDLLSWCVDAAVQAVRVTWDEYVARLDQFDEQESACIKVFHDDDDAYEEWTAQRGGFVLTTPQAGQHMLHTADCGHLGKGNFELKLTRKPRRWCAQKEPLVAFAEHATGTVPLLCQSCL